MLKTRWLVEVPGHISIHSAVHSLCRELAAVWEAEGVLAKWETSSWAKKLRARKLRAEMTDFDRFQVMLARKERSAARKAAVGA